MRFDSPIISGSLELAAGIQALFRNGSIRLYDAGSGNYISLNSPDYIISNYTLTLPTSSGQPGEVLKTDGTSSLYWGVGGGVSASYALTASYALNAGSGGSGGGYWSSSIYTPAGGLWGVQDVHALSFTGSVGIGVAATERKLHIHGNVTRSAEIALTDTDGFSNSQNWTIGVSSGSVFRIRGLSDWDDFPVPQQNTYFQIQRNSTNWTAESGWINVPVFGVGTQAPEFRLDVGDPDLTAAIARFGSIYMNPYGVSNNIIGFNTYWDGNDMVVKESGFTSAIQTFNGSLKFFTSSGSQAPGATASINLSMVISPSGSVGIGTGSPLSLMDIRGTDPVIALVDEAETDSNKQVWTIKSSGDFFRIAPKTEFQYFGTGSVSLYPQVFSLNSTSGSVFAAKLGVGVGFPRTSFEVSNGVDGYFHVNENAHLLTRNLNNSGSKYWGWNPRGDGRLDISYGELNVNETINGADAILTINTSSNVGIGTTTPYKKLHIQGTDPEIMLSNSSQPADDQDWSIKLDGDDFSIHNYNDIDGFPVLSLNYFNIDQNGNLSTTANYTTQGNVGIGTTSPSAKFHITGGTSSDQFRIGHGAIVEYRIGRNTTTGFLDFQGDQTGFTGYSFKNSAGNSIAEIDAQQFHLNVKALDANEGGQIAFDGGTSFPEVTYLDRYYDQFRIFTSNATDSDVNLFNTGAGNMNLFVDGNVGIGTTGPSEKLDVNGNARFQSIGSGTSSGALHYEADGTLTTNTSDRRLKKNIVEVNDSIALVKLLELKPSEFKWKQSKKVMRDSSFIDERKQSIIELTMQIDSLEGTNTGSGTSIPNQIEELTQQRKTAKQELKQYRKINKKRKENTDRINIGFIAQDVRKVLPSAVGKNDDGYLFLRDEQIGAITVSAIKEQQRQIEEQKLLIQQLLQRIEALENE